MGELDKAASLTTATAEGTKSYLFYGPPGTWKTTLAVHHPGKKKLYMDIDEKLTEMEHLTATQREAITVWQPKVSLIPAGVMISNIDRTRRDVTMGTKILDRPKGYDRSVAVVNELLDLAKKGTFPYDCVIIDSLTRLMDHLELLVLFQHDCTILNETLYGVVKTNIKSFVSGFLRLPCDRIMITHDKQRTKKNKEGDIIEQTVRPNITGAMSEEIMGYFSEGYYFLGSNDKGKTWMIQTGADQIKPARTTKPLGYEQKIDPVKIFGGDMV